tara:strand:- start:2519 stop:3262 length:744 start_codon:yes stop_codon:yes gene_type:complete
MEVLVDFYKNLYRQGPGSDDITKKAISLTGKMSQKNLKVADIGCGSGASTTILAQNLDAEILAIDLFPDFLEVLKSRAEKQGLSNKITTMVASMEDLPIPPHSFDIIWSEGAIYNMGFEKGIHYWKQFLKEGGVLAVSEITWLTNSRPQEIETYWQKAYPGIDTAQEKIQQLESAGYKMLADFSLPKSCWLDNYYAEIESSDESFLEKYNFSQEAKEVVDSEKTEVMLYKKFGDYYSYGFYIAELPK